MTVESIESYYTWQAMIIVMEALIRFAHRYADLAEEMAADCSDEKRRKELLTMAENCRTVPEFARSIRHRISNKLHSWYGSHILLS